MVQIWYRTELKRIILELVKSTYKSTVEYQYQNYGTEAPSTGPTKPLTATQKEERLRAGKRGSL